MNLEEYLSSYIKGKPKKSTKKKRIKQVARRGRGFGRARNFRHKDYKNTKDEINMKILQLLERMLGKDKEVEEKIYKKEEQEMKKPVLMLEEGKLKEDPQINIVENEQLKIEIGNHYRDYQTKWEHILDQQNDLLEKMSEVSEGKMNEEALEEFQLGNQRVKDEIVGLQFDLQKELNEASDISLYKDFIDFQNEVFTKAIPKFIEVDNRLVEEMKSSIQTIEQVEFDLQQREEEVEGIEKTLLARQDDIETLQDEVYDREEEVEKLVKETKLVLEKNANKQKELQDNLKIERQKTQVLEDKVFGLEEQKQGMEQTLMGAEDIDVPERQFQQARQQLLERYAETQRQRESQGRQQRFREQTGLYRDIREFFE